MSMLPTKLQALKLHFFLKDEAGRKNWTVTPGEITCKVAKVIKHTGVQDCLLILRIKLPSFWRTIRTSTSIRIWSTRNLWRTEINLKRISQKCWIRRSFSQVNKLLADEALTTLSHHLWYLAPNNTLFSLAGKKLEDRMMKSAADIIKFGYSDSLKLSDENKLQDLVTLCRCLRSWLAGPLLSGTPTQTTSSFKSLSEQLRWLTIERGVKLATDYSKSLNKDS